MDAKQRGTPKFPCGPHCFSRSAALSTLQAARDRIDSLAGVRELRSIPPKNRLPRIPWSPRHVVARPWAHRGDSAKCHALLRLWQRFNTYFSACTACAMPTLSLFGRSCRYQRPAEHPLAGARRIVTVSYGQPCRVRVSRILRGRSEVSDRASASRRQLGSAFENPGAAVGSSAVTGRSRDYAPLTLRAPPVPVPSRFGRCAAADHPLLRCESKQRHDGRGGLHPLGRCPAPYDFIELAEMKRARVVSHRILRKAWIAAMPSRMSPPKTAASSAGAYRGDGFVNRSKCAERLTRAKC